MKRKKKVFISRAGADENLADEIAAVLRQKGFDVWDAKHEILPGDNWAEKEAEALNKANVMIVLLTASALKTPRVDNDIMFAFGKNDITLLPVIIGDIENDIPWILKHIKGVRILRPHNRKKQESKK